MSSEVRQRGGKRDGESSSSVDNIDSATVTAQAPAAVAVFEPTTTPDNTWEEEEPAPADRFNGRDPALDGFVLDPYVPGFLKFLAVTAISIITFVAFWSNGGFGGSPFPAITDEPLQKASAIEVVAKLPIPPNAIAITGDGDLYVSFHSRHDRGNLKLAKWDPKTQNLTAWPTEKRQLSYWQITSLKLHGNSLYALDDGINGLTNKPKVVAFDLQKGDERLRYRTGTGRGSLVADLAVHPDGKSLYIADASMIRGLPKIFAIDVETGGRSVVLKGHHSLKANRSASILDATGTHTLRWAYFGAFPYRPAVSALAIDAKNDAMYFAAPSSREAFKVPLSQLDYARDTNSHKSARPYVSKFLDHKPVSGGMVVATNGDLYIADPQTSAIRVYSTRSGQPVLKTLVRDPEVLRWPGQLAIRDGYLYVACSALDTAFTGRKVEGGGLVVRVPLLV